MESGPSINPIEKRKPRSSLPKIALAVGLLAVLGTLSWFLIIRAESEVPAEDWVSYDSPDGDFTLRFPDRPKPTEPKADDPNGVHLVAADMRSRVYAIAYYDYPAQEVADVGADKLLDDRMKTGTSAIGGIITESNSEPWMEHPGREFWADVPGGKAHYRIFLVGRRLYQLAIIHMASFEPDGDTFFGSFTLHG